VLTLYTSALSANGRKPLALAHHLNLALEVRSVNVYAGEGRSPAYLAVNPSGKIPTLVDGDWALWESNAILQYLCDAHAGGALGGGDARQRADVARWLFWESAHWQPTLIPLLSAFVGSRLWPEPERAEVTVSWDDPALGSLLGFVEQHLARSPFLAGTALTIADFSVAGMAMYFRSAAFPFESFPAFAAWHARIEALAAWKATAVEPWAVSRPAVP
jgi:glutathione S-transferase